jgi:stearoyl-CoA desaturase (delta-9 desaturase)
MPRYENPRIDRPGATADAFNGVVTPDPAKIFWIGSMVTFGTVGSALTFSLDAVVVFFVMTVVTLCLGHSLGMHRRFIHRSYDCPKWMEYLFVHLGVLVGLAGPFGMLRTHDLRDWAQRQERCHDYFAHGQTWYRDLYWQLLCSVRLRNPPELVMEAEIANDPVYGWMERTWMLQQLPWALLFFWLGGWSWVFWGVCARVSISVLGHWMIGYCAHNTGSRDWHVEGAAVQGYNVPWCALLTMGESWHNNHHAFPGSAKLGIGPGQWDPGWWVLSLLRKAGLVANLVSENDLQERGDLVEIRGMPAISKFSF